MYFLLSSKLTRRLITELRQFFSYFPLYNTDEGSSLVDNIRSKFKNTERANRYITVRASGSSNRVPMASDDFMGYLHSYVSLKPVNGYPCVSIEWIQENAIAIQDNGGFFPTLPGLYFIQVCDFIQSHDESRVPSYFEFFVEQVLDIQDESLFRITDTGFQLGSSTFLEGSLRLYKMPGNVLLSDYTADPNTGQVVLPEPLSQDDFLSADYRVQGERTGPFKAMRDYSNIQAIPGVMLAFGQRITKGDRMLVEVSPTRTICDMEFGGRWETSIDIEVVARDIDTQREILEHVLIFLSSQLRLRWSTEGIEILQINAGGESEELYDQNDYMFRGTISLSVETEWSVRVPTMATLRRLEVMEEDESEGVLSSLVRVGYYDKQDPFFTGKPGSVNQVVPNPTYSVIR